MRRLSPILPKLEELDPHSIQFDYDRETDTLFVEFFRDASAAVSVPLGEHGYARVDPSTQKVVGVMIEEFLAVVVYELPELLIVAEGTKGISKLEIDEIRRNIAPEVETRAAMRSIKQMMPVFA